MKRKVLASILCLVFLFTMSGMALGAPANGLYVNDHRYDLTLSKTDFAYYKAGINFLADMKAIGWDFSKVIIVDNNRFADYQAAIDAGNIDSVLQPDAHSQVGTLIPGTIIPISNDGTPGPEETVSNTVEDINVTGVTLDKETIDLIAGGAGAALTATVLPANATIQSVSWSSSNTSVASVNNGIVEPLSAGTTTIKVTTTDGNFEDSCVVTVEAGTVAVTGVTLDQNTLTLTAGGESTTLTANVLPADASNKKVTWESDNASVATVIDGVVAPVAPGEATITVTTDEIGFTDICIVTVKAATVVVTGVTLDQDALTLTAGGDTETLTATVAPADATNQDVTWESSNESVASVVGGVVTPGTAGTATITVTTVDGGKTATCAVTVEAAGPTTAAEAVEMAIANFVPASGSGTFTGSIPSVKVAGNVTVEYVTMVPDTTKLNSSSSKSSFLDVNIQSAAISDLIVGEVTAANFPFAEIIAGPTATGTSLVSGSGLTSDDDNYYIQLTNVTCPQSVLDIISKAANLNSKYQMTFKSQKLSGKIKISKSSSRVVSIDNIVITGTTTITKSTLNMANGDYSNTFNCSSFEVTY